MSFFPLVSSVHLLALLLHLELVETRAQDLHRHRPVLVLRALVLAGDDDAGGQVRDAHRRIGLVDVLAAGAARAVGVDAQILVADLDLDLVLDLRVDEDGGERGVPARVGVERGDAHQAMDAAFRTAGSRTRTALRP